MNDLSKHSTEEIQAELEHRQTIANVPPSPLANPDFSKLIHMVVEGVTQAIKDQYMDEDFREYVYEAALEAIYGKDYWAWRNKQDW